MQFNNIIYDSCGPNMAISIIFAYRASGPPKYSIESIKALKDHFKALLESFVTDFNVRLIKNLNIQNLNYQNSVYLRP